jgi:hypothetical protein
MVMSHTGEVDGYHSFLRVNADKGVYYVVLGNGAKAGGALVVNNIVAKIQDADDRD